MSARSCPARRRRGSDDKAWAFTDSHDWRRKADAALVRWRAERKVANKGGS
jgi:hypothetical protein